MGETPAGPYVVEPLLDLQLQLLIQVVAEGSDNNRIPITLNVPGTIVSGHMVSASAWRMRWVESIGAMTGNGQEHLSFLPDQIQHAVDQVLEEVGEDKEETLPRWVHLLDVRMVTGAINTIAHLPLWRGRLADVAGWSIGFPD